MNTDKQIKLMSENQPEVKVVRNRYISANCIVVEEQTTKTWILPLA